MAKDSEGAHVLTALRLLRNSVHGETLQAIDYRGDGSKHVAALVGLPRADTEKLRAAFTALGGEAAWGVTLPVVSQIYADPGLLIENLLPRVLRLLDAIMKETPVERLSHVAIKPEHMPIPVAQVAVSSA